MRFQRLHRPLGLLLVQALAFAVLLASTLGQVHGTLHAPGLAHDDGFPEQIAGQTTKAEAAAPHAWLQKLFAHHDNEQCRLYDQLSGGCALPGVPLVLAVLALPSASFAHYFAQAPPGLPTPFDARGPPTTL